MEVLINDMVLMIFKAVIRTKQSVSLLKWRHLGV